MNALPYIHCRLLTQPPKTGGQGHSLLDERRCSEYTACTLHLYRLETKRCEWLVSACKLGLQFSGEAEPSFMGLCKDGACGEIFGSGQGGL
jgi:hypothetical protein